MGGWARRSKSQEIGRGMPAIKKRERDPPTKTYGCGGWKPGRLNRAVYVRIVAVESPHLAVMSILVTLFWQAIRARLRDVMSIFPLHTNLHACISHVLSLSLPD